MTDPQESTHTQPSFYIENPADDAKANEIVVVFSFQLFGTEISAIRAYARQFEGFGSIHEQEGSTQLTFNLLPQFNYTEQRDIVVKAIMASVEGIEKIEEPKVKRYFMPLLKRAVPDVLAPEVVSGPCYKVHKGAYAAAHRVISLSVRITDDQHEQVSQMLDRSPATRRIDPFTTQFVVFYNDDHFVDAGLEALIHETVKSVFGDDMTLVSNDALFESTAVPAKEQPEQ
ncbi:MAG TPA: hypothetical protein VK694_05690 [Verrucomicrobiae bacterium]|nr:hypothetical protein [Verrucomicrobiae bacterium]